jgi:DNA-binding NarL/FixJ family response regulator
MIRILVADDQPLVRNGFRMILDAEDDLDLVAEASDGLEAVELANAHRPDVVLMDVRMPNLDGVEATRRIVDAERADRMQLRVLVLTTFDLDEYVIEALRAGASGFLLKDVEPEELVSAVRIVAAGDAVVAPSITRRLIDRFARQLPHADADGGHDAAPVPAPELDTLTDREIEVLVLMARGLSNAEIAEQLLVAETTVKTHVGRVLMKLDLRDRVQAVVFAYEAGLVQPGVG